MSGNVSSREEVKFGFLVPVIFAAVLLLSALILYLIFRHNRRTVRVDTPTTSRTRNPSHQIIDPQRSQRLDYRADNSDSMHGETFDTMENKDDRLQIILQSIICKNLNGMKTSSIDDSIVNDEEQGNNMTSNGIVSSALNDETPSASQSNGPNINLPNVYSTMSCPICCESYLSDDSIAWSKNNTCNHVYHEACIINWLLKHDECPLCRRSYTGAK